MSNSNSKEREQKRERAIELRRQDPELHPSQLSARLDIPEGTIRDWLRQAGYAPSKNRNHL